MSFLLAWLTYRYVERPLRFSASKGMVTLGFILAVVTLGVCGAVTYQQDGFIKFRFVLSKAPFAANPGSWGDWLNGVRAGTCHIQDEGIVRDTPACTELVRPRVLLWGDSHAGALYPGLRALQANRTFGITQVTQSGCPPLLNIESTNNKHCRQINEEILNSLTELTPDIIILHAAWLYEHYPAPKQEIVRKLRQILQEIRLRSPTSRVIVIGPQGRWDPSLPNILTAYVNGTGITPPVYMEPPDAENPTVLTILESEMRPIAEAEGATYLIPRQILCEGTKCLTRVGDGEDDIMIVDYGHLTKAGSTFFVKRIAHQLFGN